MEPEQKTKMITPGRVALAAAAVVAGGCAFVAFSFRSARAHEMLVRTGLQVNGVQLGRTFIEWPLQSVEVRMRSQTLERSFRGAFVIKSPPPPADH